MAVVQQKCSQVMHTVAKIQQLGFDHAGTERTLMHQLEDDLAYVCAALTLLDMLGIVRGDEVDGKVEPAFEVIMKHMQCVEIDNG